MTSASGDEAGTGWSLLDASAQHEADPNHFQIPPLDERTALHRGDLVRIVFLLDPPPSEGPNAERMWVEVAHARSDGTYEGTLTNDPVVIKSLGQAASITFAAKHVAGIALPDDDVGFDVSLRAVVSARSLELDGPPGWAGRDDPVAEDDSGWSVTAGDETDDYFDPGESETMLALSLGDLVDRYPALLTVFQAGDGEWEYQPDQRRYVRIEHPHQ